MAGKDTRVGRARRMERRPVSVEALAKRIADSVRAHVAQGETVDLARYTDSPEILRRVEGLLGKEYAGGTLVINDRESVFRGMAKRREDSRFDLLRA